MKSKMPFLIAVFFVTLVTIISEPIITQGNAFQSILPSLVISILVVLPLVKLTPETKKLWGPIMSMLVIFLSIVALLHIQNQSKNIFIDFEKELNISNSDPFEKYTQLSTDLLNLRVFYLVILLILEAVAFGLYLDNWKKQTGLNIVLILGLPMAHFVYIFFWNILLNYRATP